MFNFLHWSLWSGKKPSASENTQYVAGYQRTWIHLRICEDLWIFQHECWQYFTGSLEHGHHSFVIYLVCCVGLVPTTAISSLLVSCDLQMLLHWWSLTAPFFVCKASCVQISVFSFLLLFKHTFPPPSHNLVKRNICFCLFPHSCQLYFAAHFLALATSQP